MRWREERGRNREGDGKEEDCVGEGESEQGYLDIPYILVCFKHIIFLPGISPIQCSSLPSLSRGNWNFSEFFFPSTNLEQRPSSSSQDPGFKIRDPRWRSAWSFRDQSRLVDRGMERACYSDTGQACSNFAVRVEAKLQHQTLVLVQQFLIC